MADLAVANSTYQSGDPDTASTIVNNVTATDAQQMNGALSAAVQIEAVLGRGSDLKGSAADLVGRLAVGHNADGTHKSSLVSAGSGLTSTYTSGLFALNLLLRGYLSGLGLSTAGGSATFTVATGVAMDVAITQYMVLASALNKTTSAWAVGDAQGGLDTGSITTTTWYHVYLIRRSDTGVVDVLFSLSASAPTMPAGYDAKRRIGSLKTDGASQWTNFVQDGDSFQWLAPISDVSTTNPGTSAILATLTVPTGVNVLWTGVARLDLGSSSYMLITDPALTDTVPSATAFHLFEEAANSTNVQSTVTMRTNTSAQIRYRLDASGASTKATLLTMGWFDRRGKDS